jgi:signal transduction histidine kinase
MSATVRPLERDLDRLELTAALTSRLSSERTIQGACLAVLEEAIALTGAACGEVLFRDVQSQQLLLLARRGAHPWCTTETGGHRLSTRLLERTLQDRLPCYVSDIRTAPDVDIPLPATMTLKHALSLPLVVRGRALGGINLCGTNRATFGRNVISILSILADMLALTIENMFVTERTTSEENERRQFFIRELEVTEDERRRIARELHDDLGQTLTGLVMNIDASIVLISQPGKEASVLERLGLSREIASSALQAIRRVILALRPTVLDDLGLLPAVEAYGRRVLAEAGIDVTVGTSGAPAERVTPFIENVVFRVAQETINNVARHSGAKKCRITVTASHGLLTTVVEDDGVGFDTRTRVPTHEHIGIRGMRERVKVVGGSMRITSRPGSGTRVLVKVPYGKGRGDADSRPRG